MILTCDDWPFMCVRFALEPSVFHPHCCCSVAHLHPSRRIGSHMPHSSRSLHHRYSNYVHGGDTAHVVAHCHPTHHAGAKNHNQRCFFDDQEEEYISLTYRYTGSAVCYSTSKKPSIPSETSRLLVMGRTVLRCCSFQMANWKKRLLVFACVAHAAVIGVEAARGQHFPGW